MESCIPINREVSSALTHQLEELISFCDLQPSQWGEIHRSLNELICDQVYPTNPSLIRDVVADSWVRSKGYNCPTKEVTAIKKLTSSQYNKVLKDNRLLLDTAVPLLNEAMAFLGNDNTYGITLVDYRGIVLFSNNNHIAHIDYPGTNLSEETVGTTSHSLCAKLGKPIYLISPENYHEMLRKTQVAISIPIHDIKDRVAAILVMGLFYDFAQLKEDKNLCKWLIAFQFNLAKRIEVGLQLSHQKYQTQIAKNPLGTAMSVVDDALLSINHKGLITHINRPGQKLLNLTANNSFIGMHYHDILGEIPQLSALLQSNPSKNQLINIDYARNNQLYRLKVKTFIDDIGDTCRGAIVCINTMMSKSKAQEIKNYSLSIQSVDDIFGESPQMIKAKSITKKLACDGNSIVLIGESGTGKELFARAIHNESRPNGPFIAMNCSSIPKGLIESELFGYEGGSFTGAEKGGRIGKCELANGGTLFLDEIGDMPLELQPALLRVLEDQQIMRVGGSKYIPVDFKVVAATNKNLYELVKNKAFREDLYFRLAIFKINIPPLREREDDIIDLAWSFIRNECRRKGIPVLNMEPSVSTLLRQYPWPGNVRQLKNAMQYAANMAEHGVIKLSDLPDEIINDSWPNNYETIPLKISTLEKDAIEKAMLYTHNNISRAAELVGFSTSTFYRKLKEYGIYGDKISKKVLLK